MTLPELRDLLAARGCKPTGTNTIAARCPAHDDGRASLSVSTGKGGKVLLHCHAGCSVNDIAGALGLKMADLFVDRPKRNGGMNIVATYDYHDEDGQLLFQVCRYDPKDFRQRAPDGKGGWRWKMDGVRRVPYNLPKLLTAIAAGKPVFVCEGEKDVLAIESAGFCGTCNPGGVGKWLPDFAKYFSGAIVVVIPDRDEPGRAHAQAVASALHGTAASVCIVELPDAVKDAHDYFAAGGTAKELFTLCADAEPWAPKQPEDPPSTAPTSARPEARPLGTLTAPPTDDPNELLAYRYLCRGAGLLLVGQSGQGKSSLAMQMAILWSLSRVCFGLRPTRPLKVLIVQSENDDGDVWEMFSGICAGLNLTPEERKLAGEQILIFTEDCASGDLFCNRTVAPLLEQHRPDLLVIDPALAYVGGDTKDAEVVGAFLRQGINPLLHRYACALLLVHHTTKQRADGPQATSDFLYAGAGSIEWTNWARAVLAIETRGKGCYRLHAPKRGARIGWRNANDEPEFDKFIRHTRQPGQICWLEVAADEVESVAKSGKSKVDLLAHVPLEGSIPLSVLIQKAQSAGIGYNRARAFKDELLADKTLFEWLTKRPGTCPLKSIARTPQPDPELA